MQTSQSKLPSSTQEVSSIFRYPDGTKIPFYVEPGGIQKRPQLVRSLKKNGGDISADPKLADIILVDPSTSQGRSTLRTWGHEDNIVVLHYSWITRCIQEGRAIMGDEGWGGLVAEDDGLPIEGQDTDDVPVYKSPLPTPRDTPDMHNLPRRPRQPVASSSNLNQTTTAPAPVTPFNSMPPPMPFPQGTQPGMPGMPAITPEQLQAWIPWLQYAALSTAMQTQVPLNNPMLGTMSPVSNSPIAPPSPVRSSPPKRRRTSDFVMDEVVPAAESSTHASKRRHSGNVFEDEDGESLLFYVQIQMHNRKDVVATIKKNGGRIVGNTNDADYVVLYTAGHDFKALLKSAIAAGKPAVYSRWVTDCVAKEELLDTAEYEFDQSKANPTRRRKASSVAPVEDGEGRPLAKIKRKRNSLVEEPGPSTQPSQPPSQFKFINPAPPPEPKVGTPKLKLAANIQPPQIVQPRPRPVKAKSKASTPKVPPSPSPPPEEDRTLAGRGFIFTDAEIQFLYDYARVLLARDWKISNSAISTAVYKKLPHHTLGSWRTRMSSPKINDEIEKIRKRAGIEARKSQAMPASGLSATPGPSSAGPSDVMMRDLKDSEPSVKTEPSLYDQEEDPRRLVQEDIEVAASFFAHTDMRDENNDEDIYQLLEAHASCLTANSWKEFYQAHHVAVTARYYELCPSSQP